MGRRANYQIVSQTPERIVLRDLGPWDRYYTITNDAEHVVHELYEKHGITRETRVLYFDSEGEPTELQHDGPIAPVFFQYWDGRY